MDDSLRTGAGGGRFIIGVGVRRILVGVGLAVLALALLTTAVTAGTRSGRATVKTLLFIPAVVPAVEVPLQEWLTDEPVHERIAFSTPGGMRYGDLYRPPGEGPFPAALLVLGVAPAGADDPRVVNLGNALARSGMAVLWYWSPIFAERRVAVQEIDNIAAAFEHLRARREVDPARVGMGGFCVGASFALMAAAQEEVRGEVAFVNAFGPYFDAGDLLRAIGSGTGFSAELGARPWTPDPLAHEVLLLHLVEALPDEEEANLVRQALAVGGPAAVNLGGLSPEAEAVYRLLGGLPLEEADAAVARLPAALQDDLERISPSTYVERVEAPVLVMHDREDRLVPVEESRRMAEALRAQGNEVIFTEFSMFSHVTPDKPLPPQELAGELWKLVRHMHAIMLQSV
jgi:dienelactone hydrolase